MNNHNTNFYSIEEVERTLKSTKEFEDGEQLYYFIGVLRYLYDNNKEKDKEIERLTAESTEWESKCYKYQDIIDELERSILKKLEAYKTDKDYFIDNKTMEDLYIELKALKEGK